MVASLCPKWRAPGALNLVAEDVLRRAATTGGNSCVCVFQFPLSPLSAPSG